jgi:hypothetical protein
VLARLIHRGARAADNSRAALLAMMQEAGLAGAADLAGERTLFGRIFYYRAERPV